MKHQVEDGICQQTDLPAEQCADCRGIEDWTTMEALRPGSFTAQYNSPCARCNDWIIKGSPAKYNGQNQVVHQSC